MHISPSTIDSIVRTSRHFVARVCPDSDIPYSLRPCGNHRGRGMFAECPFYYLHKPYLEKWTTKGSIKIIKISKNLYTWFMDDPYFDVFHTVKIVE